MGKRRKRGRTRRLDSRLNSEATRFPVSHCDPASKWATEVPSTDPLAFNSPRHQFDTRSRATSLLIFLLHLLSLGAVASFVIAPAGAQVVDNNNNNNVANSPVILRSEQKQLFKGLRHHHESELDQSAQDVISFLGIRYASAPMRRLRFMPPTPFNYAPNQVHDARHFAPICMQRFPVDFNGEQRSLLADLLAVGGSDATAATTSANKSAPADYVASKLRAAQLELIEGLFAKGTRRFRQLLELEQSEDCLNLDIHVPIEATKTDGTSQSPEVGVERRRADPANLRPVLVVIHGDSFDYGAGATISGARRFASLNGLLVVTFNYRLNLLGFPPKLTGASGNARTNLGLLDQVALLHWLQANIRSFGGAPRNVTLFGAGRGALFVNLLMVSPLAKGLFQRAIIEGGTALSPMLANSYPQQQQVGLQHLRLLATLADCSSSSSSNHNDGADQHQLEFRNKSSASDSLRRDFECLKSSPAELLVQPIPLGLLDQAAAAPGELVLARRWHRPLELLLRNLLELDQSLISTEARRSLNELANRIISSELADSSPGSQQQLVQLTSSQLNRLIVQLVATRHQLIRSQSTTNSSDSSMQRVSELLADFLGAIYLPSNETLIAHPFAPQLEPGTLLVHDELDLMSSMLQAQSPFGQHDLLIGSASPLIDFNKAQHAPEPGHNQAKLDDDSSHLINYDELAELLQSFSATGQLIHPHERFGSRITHQIGLTDEQAIQQVGLFVRTHFRYHQQEIANSIISNYFLGGDQLAATSHSPRSLLMESSAANRSDPTEVARLKQLQLLNSLVGAYEDALVNVPLVKTALVHSIKQLDMLADLFVGQHIYRLIELLKQTPSPDDVPKLLADEQRKLAALELDFLNFAQQLYNQTHIWPFDEVASSSSNETFRGQQPHSTFFYQIERLDSLISELMSVLREQHEHNSPLGSQVNAKVMANIKTNLINNLLKKGKNRVNRGLQQLSLGCALFSNGRAKDDDLDLFDHLRSLICDQIGQQVVANFVIGGNVNRKAKVFAADATNTFAAQVEQYESECLRADAFEQPDHHSVQPGSELASGRQLVNSTATMSEPPSALAPLRASCQRKLHALTLGLLLFELNTEDTEEKRMPGSWPVFNLFSQQLASIDAAGRIPIWSSESLADLRGAARDRFDRKIAFWANFVPTLNCSRTQPLGANALAQANNSSLLNMNLNFNCHQGARTANSLLQSIQARVKANVAEWIGGQLAKHQQRWTNAQVNTLSTQNHHSLRMATGNESQLDEMNLEAERQLNRSSPAVVVAPESSLNAGRFVPFFSSTASLFGVWLICGAVIVGSTLLAGGCALARHARHESSKTTQRKQQPVDVTDEVSLGHTKSLQGHASELVNGPYLSEPMSHAGDQRGSLDYGPVQMQQQTCDESQETILLPIISTPHYFALPRYQPAETQYQAASNSLGESNDTNTSQITPEQQQQQQQPIQMLSSSSETTTTITNRPQSSVSLVSGSTNTTNQTNNDTNGLSKQQTNKKRVKISDPKRLLDTGYMLDYQPQQQPELAQVYYNGSHRQLASTLDLNGQPPTNGASFCPVHRASSSNFLLQSKVPLEYEASTAFLTNESSQGAHYLQMLDQDGTDFIPSGVATIGSLADYLNLLEPRRSQAEAEIPVSDLASNSMRYNSQGRSNKRRQAKHNSSGLCQMHRGQMMN